MVSMFRNHHCRSLVNCEFAGERPGCGCGSRLLVYGDFAVEEPALHGSGLALHFDLASVGQMKLGVIAGTRFQVPDTKDEGFAIRVNIVTQLCIFMNYLIST